MRGRGENKEGENTGKGQVSFRGDKWTCLKERLQIRR